MKELLYDIFDNMMEKIPGSKEAGKKINDMIKKELGSYSMSKEKDSQEALWDLCCSIAYMAEREWFVTGFCYAMRLTGKDINSRS